MRPAPVIAVVLGGALLAAALSLGLPETSPFHIGPYAVSLLDKCLAFAVLALAVDLVWGFAGILSLGHAAFFALGGYAMGMHLMRQIGTRGQYGQALPDFMVFLNWRELPWFWLGFDRFPFALLMAPTPAWSRCILDASALPSGEDRLTAPACRRGTPCWT